MGGRVILAAILGGIALFVWGAIAHMFRPLGAMGQSPLPGGEAAITAELRTHVTQPGVYWIPGFEPERMSEDAYKAEAAAKIKEGPWVWMVVRPKDAPFGEPIQYIRELSVSIGLALIAAFLILVAGGLSALWARILFCVLLSGFGLLQTDVRFWNWYQFPDAFTLAQTIRHLVGGVILGVVIHLVYRRR